MTQLAPANSHEMVHLLEEKGALLRGSFTLSSGDVSTYYFDSKRLTLDPEGGFEVAKYFLEKIKETDAKVVGGMAEGAIPIVGLITIQSYFDEYPLPAFFVRKEPKTHGTMKQIEGNLPTDTDTPVAILDDVVTGGKSIMQAIELVEAEDIPIVSVMCILDRDEGGRELLRKKGYELQAMFTVKDGEIYFNP